MTAQDVVAVLGAHRLIFTHCTCGWPLPLNMPMLATHEPHVAEQLAPALAAEYERGLTDGRAQVVAPISAEQWENTLDDVRVLAQTVAAALAPHSDALAKHDAEVLRAAADEFANGHQADKPRLREAVPQWLRDRADRIGATS